MAREATRIDLVLAARAGDARALDELVASCLPLVYNIVGRALSGHPDTDDVVQETMLRVVDGLPKLRDPASFRSWLVTIAIRQVHDRWRANRLVPVGGARLDPTLELADPGADFVDLTVVRLSLSGQRRQVAEATRWLDPDDQELLSLWWLEAAGELTRPELAAALQISPQHAAVRVQRAKAQLEAARAVVRAVWATPRCPELARLTRDWDGRPSPLWRKRIARHIRECRECGAAWRGLVPAEGLLSGLALLPVPPAMAGQISAALPTVHAAHAAHAAGWLGKLLHLCTAKPVVSVLTALLAVGGGAGVAYIEWSRPAPAHTALAPLPSAVPSDVHVGIGTSAPSPRKAQSPPRAHYGSTVDTADAAPPKNRPPAALPHRAQATPITATGSFTTLNPATFQMNFHGNSVSLRGQGYVEIRWQIIYWDRAGGLVMPTWTGLSGKLFHVASGGGRRMDDLLPAGTDPPHAGLGEPAGPHDTLPSGAQVMWQNEYYYLDGAVTLHQNESGAADYNLIVFLVNWNTVQADVGTAPGPTNGNLRYGQVRDTGDDGAPVPQYVTRDTPADPTTVAQHSHV